MIYKVFASPELNGAISGKPGEDHFKPIPVGESHSMKSAGIHALEWVCFHGYAGAGKSSYSIDVDGLECRIWELKAPSGERWYIAAHAEEDSE
jgi:hypothetical protein